jgi:hypothetical protein
MKLTPQEQKFLESLSKSEVGKDIIKLLKKIETHYADIRNLSGVTAEVRIDALKVFRESLLDRMLVLSGEVEAPDADDFT